MTRKQIYDTNIELQSMIHQIVRGCRIQNYDKALRTFTGLTERLMPVLDAVFSELSYYNQEVELVDPEAVTSSLQDILTAQDNRDYVLLADLLELKLCPFLQSVQEAIRSYDGVGTDEGVWKRNMAALKERDASLWKVVLEYHERYERENKAGTWTGKHHLETTNSGAFTMAGQDEKGYYYYHSSADPEGEAVELARYYYRLGQTEYVVWGLGLGWHVREFFRLDDGISMRVFESDLDVIYHCLMAVDLSGLLAYSGFSLVYDPDFEKIVSVLGEGIEAFVLHSPSLRHIANEQIREQMEMFFIGDSSRRTAEILFENNSRENFKYYDGYVDELRTAFSGKRAVIVAAGPSLDDNVELLKNKPDDVLILAVETVFRKLINLGISIDYMIVTDANSRIYSHLAGLEQQTVPMLYLSTAYKGYAMNYQGEKYLICQNGYGKAEELAKKKGWELYETGGSVSTTALDVCIRLGCREIAFIGLDLAYTNNLAHAEGTSRRVAAEAEEMKKVPAIGGGVVPASRLFRIYNRWIAGRIRKDDVTMPVIDATEGGAVIPGLSVMTLKEYLKLG